MKLAGFIALALVFVAFILLDVAVKSLPRQELRRRARDGHDKKASTLYKVAAYGASFDLLLWLIVTLSAIGLIWLAFIISGWLVVLVIIVDSWLFVYSRRRRPVSRWLWAVAGSLAPIASGLLSFLHPVLGLLTQQKKPVLMEHSHIYEKADLLELLDRQKRQPDNRLSQDELNLTHGALTFGNKKVADIMVTRTKVRLVSAGEPIGPLLMDELHKSGLKRFPVVREISRSNAPEIIGMVEFKDLVEHEQKGKVKDLMKPEAVYVNEDQSLRQALAVFLKNHTQVLMVKNNFEEFVGTLAIEDLIEQILGQSAEESGLDEQDLQAMAKAAAKNLPAENSGPEVLK